ncbi:aminotransferase class I/II-fold pyridoxal phosphate-dependent enzyme [Altererythrobacter xixiisoli]|uniref:Aminotransferase class I/II-fold pyridoxal phosphate-dependent enzyme n=1 Tax=Croceibacterium xixiisoli TaxID=1476466 RepID=A0A6I4TWW4_9SPHN|nr:PLP-dependent aminotransferase family protein [Croceibacterium xixiisoli]MXO99601.1 aminotransferase class I/II-fold pyridoxal phosphate-dependent enzyme [Croceibacterium xixiisoli]
MPMWVPEIHDVAGPRYLAISAALARDIAAGRLRAGDRLPAQRDLAEALALDLGTITRAYAEARRTGLIDADGRRGSFVRAPVAGATQPASGAGLSAEIAPFDTGMNLPPLPADSTLGARYAASLQAILDGPAAANRLQYQPAGGAQVDRVAGARWLGLRGIPADADTVLVTSGGQNALHAIATALLKPGDAVGTGCVTYPGWLAIARRRGQRVVPLAMDEEGICPDALDRACAAEGLRALYLVPGNDNPTTATMGAERRAGIVEVARRHDIAVIEDDAYGWLSAAPTVPLAALAPERVWHVASLAKIISPALRIAYLRAPDLGHGWRLGADMHETAIMPPPLNSAIATQWLEDGSWARLVEEVRQECHARQQIVREILPPGSYRAAKDGYHLWVPLPPAMPAHAVMAALAPTGLSVVSGEGFAAGPDVAAALRVSIGGSLSREQLARALALLDTLLHHSGPRLAPLV